jgi:hypothetical protein
MMRGMKARAMTAAAGALASVLVLVGCGGGARQADSPGTCPNGTVLRGDDCVPPEAASPQGASRSAQSDKDETDESSPSAPAASSQGGDDSSGGGSSGKTAYDRDAVEAELKRAAREVKASCGSATDDDGKATGPWGQTKASIVLGRNGHVKRVTVPDPYNGKPVGACIEHAFGRIVFPPYAAPSDAVVDWDIELVPPKKH